MISWEGNNRYTEDISKATIFRIEQPLNISIHKIHGRGDGWYLNCRELNISDVNLETEYFADAETKAGEILKRKAGIIKAKINSIFGD